MIIPPWLATLAYEDTPLRVIAIDPGKSGAVARLGSGVSIIRDFKTFEDIASAVIKLHTPGAYFVAESVHAMPGQGVVSMFTFGESFGWAQGAVYAIQRAGRGFEAGEPEATCLVSPQKWQNFYREVCDIPRGVEFSSPAIAKVVAPVADYLPKCRFKVQPGPYDREKDHNTADAVLMALWRICVLKGKATL